MADSQLLAAGIAHAGGSGLGARPTSFVHPASLHPTSAKQNAVRDAMEDTAAQLPGAAPRKVAPPPQVRTVAAPLPQLLRRADASPAFASLARLAALCIHGLVADWWLAPFRPAVQAPAPIFGAPARAWVVRRWNEVRVRRKWHCRQGQRACCRGMCARLAWMLSDCAPARARCCHPDGCQMPPVQPWFTAGS